MPKHWLFTLGLVIWPTLALPNGFEDFEDARLIDHVAGSVARGYARMHGFKVEFKMLPESQQQASALLVQYHPATRTCTYLINTRDESWHSFENYLKFFEGLPKKLVYEAFFAHETGHCVQLKEQIDFGPERRNLHQELFADVFALSHVERYYPPYRQPFLRALINMRKVERGTSYAFSAQLQRLAYSPELLTALKVKDPQERAFAIAHAVDRL